MNFRRTRNKCHVHGMTHLTEVADRIDRSNSPCGGREERELYKLFKDLSGSAFAA